MCQIQMRDFPKCIGDGKLASLAIVDARIDPGIGCFSVSFKSAWEQVQIRILGPLVELAVEHSQNVHRFIVDYGVLLLVPQQRY